MDFCDYYSSETRQPGIWLSGFYGSGKSFFAKILGYLLENPTWKGTSVVDRFALKLDGLKSHRYRSGACSAMTYSTQVN